MRLQVYVRNYDAKRDKQKFVEWLYAAREKNRFNPEMFERDQVRIFTLYTEKEIVGFVPITIALVVESLAFRPGLDELTEARALEAFQNHLVYKASEQNLPDAYFVTLDESVLKFASRYGWKPTQVPMLNLHFSSLEPTDENAKKSGD